MSCSPSGIRQDRLPATTTQNNKPIVQPGEVPGQSSDGLTISRRKPSPEPNNAPEDDRKLLEREQRASHFGRADLRHVQGGKHTKVTSECPERSSVKRFGRYFETAGRGYT